MSRPRSSAAAVSPCAPVPAPSRTPRGSVRALGSCDGGTLPGVAVATERRSERRVAEPAVPAQPAAPAWLAIAAPPRPSADVMLAPSIPAIPLIRMASGARAARRSPSPGAAVLICTALVAAVASFLLATLL